MITVIRNVSDDGHSQLSSFRDRRVFWNGFDIFTYTSATTMIRLDRISIQNLVKIYVEWFSRYKHAYIETFLSYSTEMD